MTENGALRVALSQKFCLYRLLKVQLLTKWTVTIFLMEVLKVKASVTWRTHFLGTDETKFCLLSSEYFQLLGFGRKQRKAWEWMAAGVRISHLFLSLTAVTSWQNTPSLWTFKNLGQSSFKRAQWNTKFPEWKMCTLKTSPVLQI